MKYRYYRIIFTTGTIFLVISSFCLAQNHHAVENYIIKLRNEHQKILAEYLKYTVSIAHCSNKTETENKQAELIASVGNTLVTVSQIPCYKEDCTLRDSLISYLSTVYKVLKNEDTQKMYPEDFIVNSHHEFELYISGRERADEKMRQAAKNLEHTQKYFAEKYNVILSPERDLLSAKIETINKVNDHYNRVFMVFFKSYRLESRLIEAIDLKDSDSAAMLRNSLIASSAEGHAMLDTLKGYKNDSSLIATCKKILIRTNADAQSKIPAVIDYIKNRKTFESKYGSSDTLPVAQLPESMVDEYNRATSDLNKSLENVNTILHDLIQQRRNQIENWNTESRYYLERHIP